MATAKPQEYGNESISQLKGADRVRKRPGVIFGRGFRPRLSRGLEPGGKALQLGACLL